MIAIPVFGVESTKKIIMPAPELSRLIEIPGLPRLDIFIMAGWFTGIFVKISIIHYLLVLLTAQWACLRSYRPLIMPFGILLVTLSHLLYPSVNALVGSMGGPSIYFFLTLEFIVPLIILINSWLRGIEEREDTS